MDELLTTDDPAHNFSVTSSAKPFRPKSAEGIHCADTT